MDGINKHNYLEWFVSYHEGLLGSSEKETVERFLMLHPCYAADFEKLGDAFLRIPPPDPTPSFSHLKKPAEVSEDNSQTELLAAKLAFGETGIKDFSGISPEIVAEAEILGKLVLIPGKETFPDKQGLKIPENDVVPTFLSLAGGEGNSFPPLVLRPDIRIEFTERNRLKKALPVPVFPMKRAFYYAASVAAILLLISGLIFRTESTGSFRGLALERIETKNTGRKAYHIPTPAKETGLNQQNVPVHPKRFFGEEKVFIPKERIEAMAAITPIKANLLILDEPALPSTEIITVASVIDAKKFEKVSESSGYISLSEFARRQISRKLVGEETPENGMANALAGKAGDRLSKKTGKPVAIELPKTEDGRNRFHFRYGQFAFSRNTP